MGDERIEALFQEGLSVAVKTGAMKPQDTRWVIADTTGQKRRVAPAIKRELRHRAAVEPVIGHIKNKHRIDRNYLAHTQGDAVNAILAAASYSFSLILKWLRILLCLVAMERRMQPRPTAA